MSNYDAKLSGSASGGDEATVEVFESTRDDVVWVTIDHDFAPEVIEISVRDEDRARVAAIFRAVADAVEHKGE